MTLARKRCPTGFDLAPPPKPEIRRYVVSLLQAWRDAWVWSEHRRFSIDTARECLRIDVTEAEWDALLAMPRTRTENTNRKARDHGVTCSRWRGKGRSNRR